MKNSGNNAIEMSTRFSVDSNYVKQFLLNAGIETGAWLLSAGFFAGISWLAANMF
ncbi:MAG: hypothetical protein KBF32_12050 [Chitinophagales bacterium]|nr:hypothetical protein [Chitinophagales bacterium]